MIVFIFVIKDYPSAANTVIVLETFLLRDSPYNYNQLFFRKQIVVISRFQKELLSLSYCRLINKETYKVLLTIIIYNPFFTTLCINTFYDEPSAVLWSTIFLPSVT